MWLKSVMAVAMAFFLAGTAAAQAGGGGQGQPRPKPPEPVPSVAPIRVEGRAKPVISAIAPAITAENLWVLDLTDGGRVTIQLRPDHAPKHVERIKTLTRRGFYNGLSFHRVIEGFMAQGGDPTGTGNGQSDLPNLPAEFNALPHLRGSVAMARGKEADSANSQFYIMFVPGLGMDGDYTVFGRVVSGMEHVDKIQRGAPPVVPTRIVRASVGSDKVPPPTAEEIAAVTRTPAPGTAAPLRILDVPSLSGTPASTAPAAGNVPPAGTTPAAGATPTAAATPAGAQPTPQN